jgi:uncharacterized protein (TIGR02679 family)
VDKRIEWLKDVPGFHRLFVQFREKYRSFGRIGGSVKIEDFSEREIESIAGFLAISPEILKQKRTVSLKAFEGRLAKTNLEDMKLLPLLELYFAETLISKAEEKNVLVNEEKNFYEELMENHPELSWWFQSIVQRNSDTRFIQALYKEDKNELANKLITVANAYQSLPSSGKFERLPLFAQRITGYPHAFDRNQVAGRLLLHLLAADYSRKENLEGYHLKQTEAVNELLLQYGLLRDDLWSFVTCRGFTAEKNGLEHPVWKAAAQTGTVMNIPVRELMTLEKIKPYSGRHVWVLENSGVCSAIMDEVEDVAIACTHGQFKVASWIFFERLIESGCVIFYAGDIDPEGLLMAEKLKKRYPEHVVIWRMDSTSYLIAKSEEKIEDRITQLNNLEDGTLKLTAETMIKHGYAAYQEGLIDLLIADIKEMTN